MMVAQCYCDCKDNGLLQKKHKRGIKDIKFIGVLKKEHVEISEKDKKKSGISRGVQEKLMEFPWVFVFTLGFLRGVAQICKISRDESLFFLEFLKVK